MKRMAALTMLLSLILLQAHTFVPHHHHRPEAMGHAHSAQDHALSSLPNEGHAIGLIHPEVAPHDEAQSTAPAARRFGEIEPPAILGEDPCLPPAAAAGALFERSDFWVGPYSTGPPGTILTRGPPLFRSA